MDNKKLVEEIEKYKNEYQKIAENRNRLIQALQETEQKLLWLTGAVESLNGLLREEQNAGTEDASKPTEG